MRTRSRWFSGAFLTALMACAVVASARAAPLIPDDPDALKQTRSLGRLIKETPDHPVHIVFIHGIRASGPGTAQTFMKGLCAHVAVQCPVQSDDKNKDFVATDRHRIPLHPKPDATVAGEPIWTPESWERGQPFVDRYVFKRPDGKPPIIVDEVNWWTLLFPLKCKMLVGPDSYLAGVDKADLEVCHRDDATYYPWLDAKAYAHALAGPGKSGGAAVVNRMLKQGIMNWGFADAVIALGPMRTYIRDAMNGAFDYAKQYDGHGLDDQEFVVVSESLGSFVVMDAAGATAGAQHVRDVVFNTADLYFFANQFALLDMARVHGVPISSDQGARFAAVAAPAADPAALGTLQEWANSPRRRQTHELELTPAEPVIKQIIAFSDPSDVLTFNVPKVPGATVVNIFDRNAFDLFGLVVFDAGKAHLGHSANKDVLKMMFSSGGGMQR